MKEPKQKNKASDDEERKLADAVSRARARRDYWERTGEWPIGRALAMMGRFGWTIVGPPLLGVFVGRWLDVYFHSGVFWSAALVFLGVSAGFYMVWQRMHTDQ